MTNASGTKPIIGIIGVNGKFGQWAKDFFEQHKHAVVGSDIGTELTNTGLVDHADIVFIAVPIGTMASVLEEIRPFLDSDHLVIDIASVKAPFAALLTTLPCGSLSLHPMFHPSVTKLKGQTCVVSRLRAHSFSETIEQYIRQAGVKLVYMEPEEHDRTMAIVQGLTHFQAITAAHCLATLEFDPESSWNVASPIYQMRLAMIGRILSHDATLYAEIQSCNPYVSAVLDALQTSEDLFRAMLSNNDKEGFKKLFEDARIALGDFIKHAAAESERLVEVLGNA